jgi:hypothetical protein
MSEVEAGRSNLGVQPALYSEFKANLCYLARPCPKKQTKTKDSIIITCNFMAVFTVLNLVLAQIYE